MERLRADVNRKISSRLQPDRNLLHRSRGRASLRRLEFLFEPNRKTRVRRITNNQPHVMPNAATTIVRGASVEELVHSVCRTVSATETALLGVFRSVGDFPILWSGPVCVSTDCRLIRAQGPNLASVFDVIRRDLDVVWAFPDGEGAEARLYGKMTLRAESAPELDDIELPLELSSSIVCISLEIPSHGISLMAKLTHPFASELQTVTASAPTRSLQEAVAACLMTADWDRR